MLQADIRLQRILRMMLARSFPRLRRISLSISWGADDDEFLSYSVHKSRYSIWVHDSLRQAPTRVLEGGIGHELCHIDTDLRIGPFQRQLAWNRYIHSPWSRMREEWATERKLIELGYGLQLLAFVRYARRLGYSFSKDHGLSYAEIVRATQR